MILAVIPARGGSKRIPGKNIRDFAGKPIIAYSIEAALKSAIFDEVVVSTDAPEIGRIAESYGATIPFRRPPELSGDHAATMPVVEHALDWMEQNRGAVKLVCCIYPTAPFLRVADLLVGFERLRNDPTANFAFAVTSFEFPIFRAIKIIDQRVQMYWPEHEKARSQDLPEAYHDAGQFYWGRPDAFRGEDGLFNANSIPVHVPRYLVQDIDTPEDWERAERMYHAYGSNTVEAPRAADSR